MNPQQKELPKELVFPSDFVWGVATSAYQIEGAVNEDGRGDSIWDSFARTPGKVLNGDAGDVACDHYHRYAEDVALVAGLGVDAYRFSIAWPRVQPAGSGAWNDKGIAFYDRLLDSLLERGISPHITLYHWDLPQVLEEKGGWFSRDTAYRFAEYAKRMAEHFSDRASTICTHNEPWCTAMLGHHTGVFAPGYRDLNRAIQVSHHLLLSHGLAVQAMRSVCPRARLGIVYNQTAITPASTSESDLLAAEREHANLTRWYMDPVLRGSYPDTPGAHPHPRVQDGDMEIIAQPIDFMGINYYTRMWVSTEVPPLATPFDKGETDMGWEIYPEGLAELLTRHKRDYPNLPPIYITENGMANADHCINDEIADYPRIEYLRSHLSSLSDAMAAGVDVKGYFCWSLLDNFEWNSGYSKRFGLVYVDYPTQKRIPKKSAHWYRDFITTSRRATTAQGATLWQD